MLCKAHPCPHELQVGQEGKGSQQFLCVGAYQHGDMFQDLNYLTLLLRFQFAYAVVGLHHLLRFYEHGLARCALVVHNATQALLQRGAHGYYQTSLTEGRSHVLCHQSLVLHGPQYAVQGTVHATLRSPQFVAYSGQFRTCLVLYLSVLVQSLVYGPSHGDEGEHPHRQLVQSRVGMLLAALCRSPYYPEPRVQCIQRLFQSSQVILLYMCPFQAYALYGRTEIVERHLRQFHGLFQYCFQFLGLLQFLAYCAHLGKHPQFAHALSAQFTLAEARQQAFDFLEPYFAFVIIGINHKFFSGYISFHHVGSSCNHFWNQAMMLSCQRMRLLWSPM